MNWKPIETAPRDGSRILVFSSWDWSDSSWSDLQPEWITCVWREDASIDEDDNDVGGFISVTHNPYKDIAKNPTHWMPLPPPPQE